MSDKSNGNRQHHDRRQDLAAGDKWNRCLSLCKDRLESEKESKRGEG